MNEWAFALAGVASGLGFGYGYGLQQSSKIFTALNARGMEELGRSIATITNLREQVSILKDYCGAAAEKPTGLRAVPVTNECTPDPRQDSGRCRFCGEELVDGHHKADPVPEIL